MDSCSPSRGVFPGRVIQLHASCVVVALPFSWSLAGTLRGYCLLRRLLRRAAFPRVSSRSWTARGANPEKEGQGGRWKGAPGLWNALIVFKAEAENEDDLCRLLASQKVTHNRAHVPVCSLTEAYTAVRPRRSSPCGSDACVAFLGLCVKSRRIPDFYPDFITYMVRENSTHSARLHTGSLCIPTCPFRVRGQSLHLQTRRRQEHFQEEAVSFVALK